MILTVWLRERLLLLACMFLASTTLPKPFEYIVSFDSQIKINQDASLTVTETIVVQAEGIDIKRGIYRSFPTRYGSSYSHFVSFDVESVRCQGKEVPYRLEKAMNGIHIYIGDPHISLRPGRYAYEIRYRTGRQLGAFADHDELYWNVTGQDWAFPIERVTARVELPQAVPAAQLKATAYKGYTGSSDQSFITQTIGDGRVTFKTDEPLQRSQGLTIVVGWPKGIITGPGFLERLKWALLNIYTLLMLYAIIMLALFLFMRHRINKENKSGTIIPLFYPPKDWTPGMVSAFMHYGYEQQAFAADIVGWAVDGFITIQYDEGAWYESSTYTLKLTDKKSDQLTLTQLFGSSPEIKLDRSYNAKIEKAFNELKKKSQDFLEYDYIAHCFGEKTLYGLMSVVLALLVFGVDTAYYGGSFVIITFGICAASIAAAIYAFKGYTPKGQMKYREIKGFELFLSTTEKERMNMVGTPPNMTPSLYEQYLPYAMALGVEERWTAQFTPIFARLEKETGVVYTPHWYYGRSGLYSYRGMGSGFSSNLRSSLQSVISSAATPPGSSSGFGGGRGGGGSAGGGGGGGGGGGW